MTNYPKTFFRVALWILGVLIVLQPAAMADVTMQLTGTNQSFSMGGVYTSPYQITVDGKTVLLLACDDFGTDISMYNKWWASVSDLPAVGPSGPQKFKEAKDVLYPTGTGISLDGQTINPTIQDQYYAASWLANQLLTDSSIRNNPKTSGYYSYAIWQIFDSTAESRLTPDQQDQVTIAMALAFQQTSDAAVRASLDSMVDIYTPVNKHQDGFIFPSQEFIGVQVPEGSTFAFLAFDFLALPGIILFVRRRILR